MAVILTAAQQQECARLDHGMFVCPHHESRIAPELELCRYSARHASAGIPAVTVIECGPVGAVPACQECADFYVRMG